MIAMDAANAILSTPKALVRPMHWSPKLSSPSPGWVQYSSALTWHGNSEVAEDLMIDCLWRPKILDRASKFRVGVRSGENRIYALDISDHDRHLNNKAGRGRAHFQRTVHGPHEHTWSSDGYGYAEAIDLNTEDLSRVWQRFLQCAGIDPKTEFVHPDSAINFGQGKLPL